MARKRTNLKCISSSVCFLLSFAWATLGQAQALEPVEAGGSAREQNSESPITEPSSEARAELPDEAEPPEPTGYRELIDDAIREHELSHFWEARELLLKAHALFPNARTLRGLGKVEYELRNYGHAVIHLEKALASSVKPLDARLRAEVEELLSRSRAYVGQLHVTIEPSSATVIVDGVTVVSGPQASLPLVVGDHVIELQAAGHMPERRTVRIKGGEHTNVEVVLHALHAAAGPGLQEREQRPHGREQAIRRKRWLAFSLSVAAVAATGLVLGLTLRHNQPERAAGGSSGVVLRSP